MSVEQITPKKLQQRLAEAPDELLVLDVREPAERSHCHIPGSLHIPMQQVPSRLGELPTDAEIVVLCHHGMRSMQVAQFLEQRGYRRICNLAGGIDAWSTEVDSSVPRY